MLRGENKTIDFEEAAFGCKRKINIIRSENCEECGGSGAKKGTSPKTCTKCNGTGQMRTVQNTPFGQFASTTTCNACGGQGSMISDPCPKCNGSGHVRNPRELEVNIPAGIDDGQGIVLRGEGCDGMNGGATGDLQITFSVQASDDKPICA